MSEYNVGDHVIVDSHTGAERVVCTISEVLLVDEPIQKGITPLGTGPRLRYRSGARIIRPEEIHGPWQATISANTDIDEPNERANILNTAKKLINGDRAKDYGDPNENFGRIANLWNAQFAHKLNQPLTAQDVAYALIHLKMSRLANTPGHRDSLIDVCGYAALSGELK